MKPLAKGCLGLLKSIRVAAIAWALSFAVALNSVPFALRWWHPYCRRPEDGPGVYGFGTPLPYAEPGPNSLSWDIIPYIYVLDVGLLAALGYLLLNRGVRPLAAALPRRAGRVVAVALASSGVIVLLALTVLEASSFLVLDWRPATRLSDRYVDYRPAFMVDMERDGKCDR